MSDIQTSASVGYTMTAYEIARSVVGFAEQDHPGNDWWSVQIARRHLEALVAEIDRLRAHASVTEHDPLRPSASLLVKLGSALVHAEELTGPGAHPFDHDAFKTLASDSEVVAWRAAMDAKALLPVKR